MSVQVKLNRAVLEMLGFKVHEGENISIYNGRELEWRSLLVEPHNPELNHLIEFTDDNSHWRPCVKRIAEYLTSEPKPQEPVVRKGANGEDVATEFYKSDYITHHGDFVTACEFVKYHYSNIGDLSTASYWDKQMKVLSRLKEDYHHKPQEPAGTFRTGDKVECKGAGSEATFLCYDPDKPEYSVVRFITSHTVVSILTTSIVKARTAEEKLHDAILDIIKNSETSDIAAKRIIQEVIS